MTESEKDAKIVVRARKRYPEKPIIACFMGGKFSLPGIEILGKNKIPNYFEPRKAAKAMQSLIKKFSKEERAISMVGFLDFLFVTIMLVLGTVSFFRGGIF